MAQVFQSQVISLIVEGAFDRFPGLRVALIEGGFTWMPSLMWRIDKEWKGLRHNTPWVRRPPSDYMRDHIRLTTQPLDAPPNPDHLRQIVEQMESDDMLMLASDYPHFYANDPRDALLAHLDAPLADKIAHANAATFYRL
ncbi:MAG: amidohydrolase family protein [Caldilineaceae bacterium]|nr:amidohydrolase family protein [Caldilineaceae bacterium]